MAGRSSSRQGGRLPVRSPGLMCETCAKRALSFGKITGEPTSSELEVFKLKLRDWLSVERVEMRPCLSVCPETGLTIERRGKTMVMDQSAIDKVNSMFDPTRQLSFLDPEDGDEVGTNEHPVQQ